ncbi:uncharacterized protein LOC134210121 [Armigeres subalbatus]|uniref:uncharacterized protein LOC134210121 n=1 Tax=Armigeres subalbatus TaxID=124917 RepID=UPI002ED33F95
MSTPISNQLPLKTITVSQGNPNESSSFNAACHANQIAGSSRAMTPIAAKTSQSSVNKIDDTMQSSKIIQGSDGRKYVEMGYDCYAELPGETQSTENDEVKIDLGENEIPGNLTDELIEEQNDVSFRALCELQNDIAAAMKSRLDAIEAKMDQILLFMANINKFMSMKHSGSSTSEKKREYEDFTEFEKLFLSRKKLRWLL